MPKATKAAYLDDIDHAIRGQRHNAATRILLVRYTVQRPNFEKMPRTAQNLQKPKANERRPPNYTLQHAVRETRSSATNAYNNTGSAVLAPHGALGFTSGDVSGRCV